MLLVTSTNVAYVAHFHYPPAPDRTLKLSGTTKASDQRREVHCTLHVGVIPCVRVGKDSPCTTIPAFLGIAKCSEKDQFTRNAGRKEALRRALTTMFPGQNTRGARHLVWEAYFKVIGHH